MPYRAFVGLRLNRDRLIRIHAAAAYLGARSADWKNPPDVDLAAELAGDAGDVEAVLLEWDRWRRDRHDADRGR